MRGQPDLPGSEAKIMLKGAGIMNEKPTDEICPECKLSWNSFDHIPVDDCWAKRYDLEKARADKAQETNRHQEDLINKLTFQIDNLNKRCAILEDNIQFFTSRPNGLE